jgi:hypothetical protein
MADAIFLIIAALLGVCLGLTSGSTLYSTTIKQAELVCSANQGLTRINSSGFRSSSDAICGNGAVFSIPNQEK